MLTMHYLQFRLCNKTGADRRPPYAPKVRPISSGNPSNVKGQVTLVTMWSPWRPLSPGTSHQSSEWETIQFKHSRSFWKSGTGGIITYCVNKGELSSSLVKPLPLSIPFILFVLTFLFVMNVGRQLANVLVFVQL